MICIHQELLERHKISTYMSTTKAKRPGDKEQDGNATIVDMSHKETRVRYDRNSTSESGRGSSLHEEIRIYDNPFSSYYAFDRQEHDQHFPCFKGERGPFFYVKDACYPIRRACVLITCCLVSVVIVFLLFKATEMKESNLKYCYTQECIKTAAFLLTGMDQNVNPCDDFFQYACGMWNRIHVIPEDRSSITTFEVLADQLQHVLRRLLEDPISSRDNSATEKAKKIYKSCINTTEIKLNGERQMKSVIDSFGGWPVADITWTEDKALPIEKLFGRMKRRFNDAILFDLWVGVDDKNSSAYIIQMDQLQLGLPNRDYYLNSTDAPLRAYHELMTDIASLYGAEKGLASSEMRHVLDFEIILAGICMPEMKRQDTSGMYEKFTLAELQHEIPQINWQEFLQNVLEIDVFPNEPIVIYSLPYYIELGKVLSNTDKRVVQNYAIWRLLMDNFLPHLTGPYQQARLAFKKVLMGISTERNRWVQCVEWTNKRMGMAVGALFIRENFNPDSKESAIEMIRNIREAFNELLNENVWMDEDTKHLAKQKADAINERIGYPDILMSSSELEAEFHKLYVSEDHFFLNMYNILHFKCIENLEELRTPVDRDRWSTEPAIVNAFYSPNKNDIVFPAGILQPFFYSKYFPKSVNYGGIGVVIGHEITHGFDDKGRQFDKNGNLKQWWNNATIQAFKRQTKCIIDQYSAYKIEEIGLNLNGYITQGENIADNGGLKQSFRAYQKYVQRNGEELLLPGLNLTHEQLFFLNYAQIWCGTMRPEEALARIRSSGHSPGRLRVIGPLSNSHEFAKAFNCRPKTPMNPIEKCIVW